MPDPVTGTVGALSAAGAISSSKAASKGAKATTKAANQATALEREMFERGVQEVAPFKQIGIGALGNLAAAANEPVQQFAFRNPGQFLNEYFNSPEFLALNNQATDQILRNSSVTGGLRSGNANAALSSAVPMLGIQALERANQQDLTAFGINQGARADRFNQLFSLGSLGANVASGNQVAGSNFASQAGANALMAGQATANAYNQRANAVNGLLSDAGSIYLGNRMGYFGSSPSLGGSTGDYTGEGYRNWVAMQRGKI